MRTLSFNRTELHLVGGDHRGAPATHASISGVQDKALLTIRGVKYIIKPNPSAPIPRFQNEVAVNECLTMDIAGKVFDIKVAEHELVKFADGELAYLTKRFDYRGGIKIPQEDFCQLSNRNRTTHGENYKYDGSYEECGELLRKYSQAWRVELGKLFRLIVFNYVFSNGDAHLKNFSLQASSLGDDYVLTPAYDLLATSLHFPTESALALELFKDGHYTEAYEARGFYSAPDFIELGGTFDLPPNKVRVELERFAQSAAKVEAQIAASALSLAAKREYLRRFRDRLHALAQR